MLDAFGTHYLGEDERRVLASVLRSVRAAESALAPAHANSQDGDGVSFARFVRLMLHLMARPHRTAAAAASVAVELEPQALAALYGAFSLFDARGKGQIR